MRCAIVADIHGNLAALEAVLRDIEERGGCDQIWCLGDIVGYGPQPTECIARIRQSGALCVAGNHDWAAIGKIPITDFNPDAAQACRWTSQQLCREDVAYLDRLPLTEVSGEFTIVHGSPREPIWEYVLSTGIAEANLPFFRTRYCLIGHSHVPLAFEQRGKECLLKEMLSELWLGEGRLLINPGSVGQPRDGDPRASYAILDDGEGVVRYHRVPYEIAETQEKMVMAGLPLFLATRLSYGW
ncbi:MAG: metallophosphoesterase family protein [Chloroflexota bacterium]|nr:metallophosphoesterase family protein [Chloroflexota bacterium]